MFRSFPKPVGCWLRRLRPREVVRYWEGVFDRFVKTATWKQYVEQNQFEDGYLKGPSLSKFFDDLTVQMRDVLKEAGAKVVR